jgi:hypothetical protein
VTFTNCIVRYNEGIYAGMSLDVASPLVVNCQFYNNLSGSQNGYDYASAIEIWPGSNPVIRNTLFNNNEGTYLINDSGSFELLNCTIANNKAWNTLYAIAPLVRNTLFNGNKDYNGTIANTEFYGSPTINYCLAEEVLTGTGNLAGTASFRNPTDLPGNTGDPGTGNSLPRDYSLVAGSLGVNMGNNSYVSSLPTDLAGQPRIYQSTVDIGCYEYVPAYTNGSVVNISRAVRLDYDSELGRNYQFLQRESPASTNWLLLGDVITGNGQKIYMFDTATNSQRIYRVSDFAQ